jgi:hypothetical protein
LSQKLSLVAKWPLALALAVVLGWTALPLLYACAPLAPPWDAAFFQSTQASRPSARALATLASIWLLSCASKSVQRGPSKAAAPMPPMMSANAGGVMGPPSRCSPSAALPLRPAKRPNVAWKLASPRPPSHHFLLA